MNNFRLLADISKVAWTTAEEASIREGLVKLNSDELQREFFIYCKKWKLAPWTFSQLKKYELLSHIDDECADDFQKEYTKVLIQNNKRNSLAINFLEIFNKAGIDVIVLKGNYLAHTVYKEIGYKRMNDFDILIHKEDWDKIQDIYLGLGYIPLGFGWGGEKEKPADYSHVGMAFISPDYSCIVGSQWGLKSPTTSYNVDIDEVWDTAVDFDFNGLKVKALSNEFNLLHLILHMGIYKCGIRDCMDVYNLMLSAEIDQKELIRILEKSIAVEKAYFTLSMSNLCVKAFSDDLIKWLSQSKNGYLKTRMRKRIESAKAIGDFQIAYNDYFQDIEKDVIYFNLFPQFHYKLVYYSKIIMKIYFAESSISLKLNDKAHRPNTWNKTISFFKAPYFIFSLIAQEIGWRFAVLLFFKLFVDLIVSLKNYVVKKESYFDYLKGRGIDPKEISKAVKNIQ